MAGFLLVVFDVNETLLDLTIMEPTFERLFRDTSAAENMIKLANQQSHGGLG
jgi:hypothetical protein